MRANLIVLLLALSVVEGLPVRGECRDLRSVADASEAAATRDLDAATNGIDTAWQGKMERPNLVFVGEGGKKFPVFTPTTPARPISPVPPSVNGRGETGDDDFTGPTIAERRAELRKKDGLSRVGKFFRAVGYGLAGFLVGVLGGWLAGGAAGYAFVKNAPNPKIQKYKWLIMAPAVIVGAVIGEIAMPFILAGTFGSAEPYPSEGVPDRQGLD